MTTPKTTLSARWHQIIFQPMEGVPERFTAGFVIRDENGHVVSRNIIASRACGCLFGKRHKDIVEMIDMALNSAAIHLKNAFTLDNWNPPIGGFYVGLQTDATGFDQQHILQQAIALSTSLMEPEFDHNEHEEGIHTKQWISSVRGMTPQHLRCFFDKKIKVGRINETVGFFAEPFRYAAHFSVFRGSNSSSIKQSFNSSQGKLWKLDSLRDKNPLLVDQVQLIIGHLTAPNEHDRPEVPEYIQEVISEAKRREIDVQVAKQPENAARLISMSCHESRVAS